MINAISRLLITLDVKNISVIGYYISGIKCLF